ncbi:MAG: TerC family protein, partial [Rhodospirillaceae bacterium]
IATGIKMILVQDHVPDLANNALIRFMNRHFRVTEKLHGHDFFVRLPDMAGGQPVIYLTPLFLALVLIEVADVIFAVDSVPAIFAVTTDPFIVYTSNIFAILGLRALYFALSAMLDRFKYLKYAISVLLVFIGSKLFIADLLGLKKFPAMISLAITFIILGAGIGFSLWKTRSNNNAR